MVLTGTEVKSVRGGLANLKDSYGLVKDDAVWLLNAHIGPYEHGNIHNHAPLRTRKLLMHREEIRKLIGKTQQKGLTLIPDADVLQEWPSQGRTGVGQGQAALGQARDRAAPHGRQRSQGGGREGKESEVGALGQQRFPFWELDIKSFNENDGDEVRGPKRPV